MSDTNPLQLLHDKAGCCDHTHTTRVPGCFRCETSADEVPDPEPCPECAQGKHGNCDGTTWDNLLDEPAPCPCEEAGH